MVPNASQVNGDGGKKVIIVGAGPVGLLAALRLAQAGIPVDVMEKASRLNEAFRAVGYYGGALVALDRASVLEKAVDIGFVSPGLCWRKPVTDDGNGGKQYGDVIARLPFPQGDTSSTVGKYPSLQLPQSKLTKLLYDEAKATGLVTVHFDTELTHVEDNGDFVSATFTKLDTGEGEKYEASFLIGADGARSATRKLLDISFRGYTWPLRLVAIDFVFETPPTADMGIPTSFTVHPTDFGVMTPTEKPSPGERSSYRCAAAPSPHDQRPDAELETKEAALCLLEKMVPGPRPLNAEILRAAPYRIHQLCATRYRRGRCLLAGDAAHLNNPFGTMGLSTGLLDADALADTLELIINEGKPLGLLDVYADERQRVFQFFTDPVSASNMHRAMVDPEQADDDWLLTMLKSNPAALAPFGRHFQDTWRTDIRKLVAEMSLS